jgi:TatD DNase family protein
MNPAGAGRGTPLLLDAHLHLHDPKLRAALGPDARFPGVAAQLVNGTHPDDWEAVRALQDSGGTRVLKAYGVHPWRVDKLPDDWEARLRECLAAGAVSVGEIGLDRWIEPRDERRQLQVLEIQLRIAAESALPPTLHCLRAWGMLVDALRAAPPQPRGFLVHGFGGSVEVMHQLLDLGACFSFSAHAADPARKRMRDAIRACPPDRLLAETDAPDMVPPPDACRYPLEDAGGRRLHHPAEIATAYALLAELRGVPASGLARDIAANFGRLFVDMR